MDPSGATLLDDEQWGLNVLLPHRPSATNYLDRGQYRMSRPDALSMRYIEHSPHALLGSIVIDVDDPDAAMTAFRQPSDFPPPNWVAQTMSGPHAGFAHLGWWLGDNRVCRTDSARLTPLRYASRIEAGLRFSIKGADWAYGGQLTKNPAHQDWETIYGPASPYRLRDLVTPAMPRQMPRLPERSAGLGRNVAMFDVARKWAYPMWWRHREGTSAHWERTVLQRCHAVNSEFPEPLPFVEVKATSQSISRWIWRNFDEGAFRERQAHRGRIMTEKKREANRKRATKVDPAKALEVLL